MNSSNFNVKFCRMLYMLQSMQVYTWQHIFRIGILCTNSQVWLKLYKKKIETTLFKYMSEHLSLIDKPDELINWPLWSNVCHYEMYYGSYKVNFRYKFCQPCPKAYNKLLPPFKLLLRMLIFNNPNFEVHTVCTVH